MKIRAVLLKKTVNFIICFDGGIYRYPTSHRSERKDWDSYKAMSKRSIKKNESLAELESKLKQFTASEVSMFTPYQPSLLEYLEMDRAWIDTGKLLKRYHPKVTWRSLSFDFMKAFRDWMLNDARKRDGSHYSVNTFNQHYTLLKAALESAIRNGHPYANKRIWGLKTHNEHKERVYLNEDELKKIEDIHLEGDQDIVRKMFLIGAYSGARMSDFKKMSRINIFANKLKYTTQKTGVNVSVPLHPYISHMIMHGDKSLGARGDISEESERVYINRYIKFICDKAGINDNVLVSNREGGEMKSVLKPKYELITSHTARRSFATNLALRGVSETVIQRFLGHTNIKQTSKYIVCSADDVLDRMENVEFFK